MSQTVHLRKYGVAATIDFELYEPDGVDLYSAALAAADVEVQTDGGDFAQSDNASATEDGTYSVLVSAAELTGARVVVKIVDAPTKAYLDKIIIIETYGNASAQFAFDLDEVMRGTDNAALASSSASSIIPAGYIGDYELGETLHFAFTSSGAITGTDIRVFKDDSDTKITTAQATLDAVDAETNMYQVSIVLGQTNYDPGADYQVVLSGATIGGNAITAVLATFSIENRFQEPVHRQVAK